MSKCIIFNNGEGGISVMYPTAQCLIDHNNDMKSIGERYVPANLKFKIELISNIPVGRDYRGAWTMDEAEFIDGVGTYSEE